MTKEGKEEEKEGKEGEEGPGKGAWGGSATVLPDSLITYPSRASRYVMRASFGLLLLHGLDKGRA